MINILYDAGCKECRTMSPLPGTLYVIYNEQVLNHLLSSTEFSIRDMILDSRSNKNQVCEYCGSSNVEVMKVRVNSHRLFDINDFIESYKTKNGHNMIMFKLDKVGSQIKFQFKSIKENLDLIFFKQAIQALVDQVKNDNDLISKDQGDLFMAITGSTEDDLTSRQFQIESFRNIGFSKDEILNEIKSFAKENNLFIKI